MPFQTLDQQVNNTKALISLHAPVRVVSAFKRLAFPEIARQTKRTDSARLFRVHFPPPDQQLGQVRAR